MFRSVFYLYGYSHRLSGTVLGQLRDVLHRYMYLYPGRTLSLLQPTAVPPVLLRYCIHFVFLDGQTSMPHATGTADVLKSLERERQTPNANH
jgi:hypothetical protein